jgi:CHAT domain-containing protein
LWDVHDDSTREFMVAFYSHMRLGGSKAEALQAACLRLRDRHLHPYYWAPFLLIGKG